MNCIGPTFLFVSLFGTVSTAAAQDYSEDYDLSAPVIRDFSGQWTDGNRTIIVTGDSKSIKAGYPEGKAAECDLRNGRKVPYEEDFHGDISDDGHSIGGMVSYCHWNTRQPSTSGVKQAPFKGRFSADGSKMDVCYKTPYGKGGNKFTVTADYSKAEIRLRLYIPAPIVGVLAPVPGTNIPMQIFSGDGRAASYDTGTNRAFQSVVVTADPTRHSPQVGKKRAWFGESHQFAASQGAHVAGKPEWWWQLNSPSEVPNHSERLARSDANSRIEAAPLQVASPAGEVDVKLTMNASIPATQPMRTAAFAFNADLVVLIRQTAREQAQYVVFGGHDEFPAYELYINKTLVYSYDPEAAQTKPFWGLMAPEKVHIDTGYRTNPPLWSPLPAMPVSSSAPSARGDLCDEVADVEQIKEDSGSFLSP